MSKIWSKKLESMHSHWFFMRISFISPSPFLFLRPFFLFVDGICRLNAKVEELQKKPALQIASKKVSAAAASAVGSSKEEKKHEDTLQKLKKQLLDMCTPQPAAMMQRADEATIASILQKYIDCVREPQNKVELFFDKIDGARCMI